MLARGMAPAGNSTLFDLVRLSANLRATLRLVARRERRFTVTAKGRTGRASRRDKVRSAVPGAVPDRVPGVPGLLVPAQRQPSGRGRRRRGSGCMSTPPA